VGGAGAPIKGSSPASSTAPLGPTVVTVLEYDLGRFLPSSTSPTSASSTASQTSSTVPPELTPAQIVRGTEIVQGLTWEDTFARQRFTAGTPCGLPDLVNKARRTEVRFVCDQSGALGHSHAQPPSNPHSTTPSTSPSFLSLTEVSTCEYVAVVSVPSLCRHPKFSPSLPTVHEIKCVELPHTGKDRRRQAREERRRQQSREEEDEEAEEEGQTVDRPHWGEAGEAADVDD
jgi:hypothetical protein